ncbi:ABC transporter substrate-binding protein (plasmid) [Rhizobium sp. B230/85]|uniref:ABC transporter substrate-binding protein n=1 Tax=unclassified Rhizobium TaxID=2613769 RepID=UPI001ADA6927|nr:MULTISPECIES: ABC transporter substrate-binding protein [unclassified Rhizobium]MBO9136721.1 ABC transporter substrate-binding protein [Rhizobium sp. B209b/85]QXZ99560.1 ABC transporter substrate-binding protein [Rhizobium sp. B230/85]
MNRRTFLVSTTALAVAARFVGLGPAAASGEKAEKPNLTIGVGGKPLLYYLPLTIAERKGFFEEEGLNVIINDFSGGAKSLQALIGGSLDVVVGAYEHTIRMQNKGQDIAAVCGLGRFPGIVIAVRKSLASDVRSVRELKGRKMAVTAPGSSTALMLQYALIKNGLKADDVALVGTGGGASALAALKSGEVDGLSYVDPVIAQLEREGEVQILIDTRTEAGTRELFGGPNPAASVYTTRSFIEANPITIQKLVNAFLKALKFIQASTPEDIAAAVPQEYLMGDKSLYVEAFKNSREMYSLDGMVTEEGYKSMMSVLKTLDPELANSDVPFSRTFDPSFVKSSMR